MGGATGSKGRVAVVTGAGGGLGRAYAQLLAARGARVLVNDSGISVDGLHEGSTSAPAVVEAIVAAGGEAIADDHDVSTAEGGEAVIAAARDAFGQVDIIVHNAGISRRAPFEEMEGPALHDVLSVHLLGAFHVVRPAWSGMVAHHFGRIILTSSGAAFFGGPRNANYGAAKMGMVGLALCLAEEGASHNVLTNVIVPIARTRMAGTLPPDVLDRLDPDLVAPVVSWLADEQCTVTGEIFSAAGGRFNRMAIAVTEGFEDPDLTVEMVRDNFEVVRDLTRAVAVGGNAEGLHRRLPAGLSW